jgi:hypothetical protein
VESNWVHSARRPPICPLYLPWVIMTDNLMEWWLAGETEVLGENLPQCHFVHKSHMTWPGAHPVRLGEKIATNSLIYDKALWRTVTHVHCTIIISLRGLDQMRSAFCWTARSKSTDSILERYDIVPVKLYVRTWKSVSMSSLDVPSDPSASERLVLDLLPQG